jgi:hypothetical protein
MLPLEVRGWIKLCLLAFCLSLLPGCSNNDDQPEPDVYVAGSVRLAAVTVPCFWKNGARIDLETTEGYASSVYVSGNDVWIAGYKGDFSKGQSAPGYWLNGSWRELIEDRNAAWGIASSILVAAGDIYVTGYIRERSSVAYIPCIWKNGVRCDLDLKTDWSPDSGNGSSLFVSGGDIFVAGAVWHSGCFQSCPVACYWQNGARTDMDDSYSRGSTMIVSQGIVYMAGEYISTPCYWQNGVRTDLGVRSDYSFGSARAIRISPDAILVAGTLTDNRGKSIPCVWRNGVREELDVIDASQGGDANSLCLSGSDLFVAGICETSTTDMPCYWKNGARTDLSLPDGNLGGRASSIFVSGE